MRRIALTGLMALALAGTTLGEVESALGRKAVPFKIDHGELVLPGPIAFTAGTAKLLPESASALEYVKAFMTTRALVTLVRIEGHVVGGEPGKDQALSEKRAVAVARWLAKKGVDCRRLIAVGFGSTKPVASGDSPEGRAQNMRVVVAPAALRGVAIGGAAVDGGGRVALEPCK